MSFSTVNTLQVGPGLVQMKAIGGNVPSVITPVEAYSLQSFSFDIDQKIVSASGSMKLPFDSAPVDMTIKGTMELLELKGAIFSNLISGDTPSVGGSVGSYKETFTLASVALATWAATTAYTKGEAVTIGTTICICSVAGTSGATSPTPATTLGGTVTDGTVTWVSASLDTGSPTHVCLATVAQAQYFAEDLGVQYQSNNDPLETLGGAQGLTPLPAPPAVGEYISVGNTGFYLFNATDAVDVYISYNWTSATLVNANPILNHWIGWGPYCELNAMFPYQSVDQQHVLAALHLNAVRFGSQKAKTKRDGYMTVTYDFEAFCPANNVAGYLYLPD